MKENLRPAVMLTPGEFIAELLADRDWTQVQLAEIMGRPTQAINGIVRGKREITPETALQLAEAFESSPTFFMNLEMNYRLRLAEQKCADSLIKIRERLSNMPHAQSA